MKLQKLKFETWSAKLIGPEPGSLFKLLVITDPVSTRREAMS